jgi:AcrR family transcriptional regulator
MSKAKETGAMDASTENRIKNAARIVFQKKGFAATRTRDIAEEAGINLALLNYYFRTKEKLFEIVMMETLSGFLQGMAGVFNDENTTFEYKIELLAINYIDFCMESPNIPIFVLSEIRNRHDDLLKIIPVRQLISHSVIIRQFQEKAAKGEIGESNLLHFIMNIMGLIIFPFVGQPIVMAVGELNDTQFNRLMQERKKLIPKWIKAMFFTS